MNVDGNILWTGLERKRKPGIRPDGEVFELNKEAMKIVRANGWLWHGLAGFPLALQPTRFGSVGCAANTPYKSPAVRGNPIICYLFDAMHQCKT